MSNQHSPSSAIPAGPSSAGIGVRKFSKARPLAARLGIHAKTIFRWAESGRIARFKLNERVVLFDEAEVSAFIESARVEGRKDAAP